jgi:predicted transcriptional regulator of viral defense system
MVQRLGIVRPRDLAAQGIPATYLHRLTQQGLLERVVRGLYRVADSDASEHQSLTEACKKVPHGIVCLLSALRFHQLTTQNPSQVWIAIDVKARRPRVDYPPLRIVRFSGAALHQGVILHEINGSSIRVYEPAKTVADCFKYRQKIGLDVALEALREYRRQRRPLEELWQAAEICRMAKVMRPYLEALT